MEKSSWKDYLKTLIAVAIILILPYISVLFTFAITTFFGASAIVCIKLSLFVGITVAILLGFLIIKGQL